ncbi:hypothetical protein C7456_1321 [Fulvimonas soli]|jgi:hypothetical protein|uniref:Uncharacterized protein n=1 Tax=Fulvimonas soli TaxID=155197 RepID=A0A316HL00_9GAMM|nr:hypothetical protein C7456_1321 [Fulvimonas soli]
MFTKLSPQKVQSDEGYVVQVANRSLVEYVESNSNRVAVVEVDFSGDVGIYVSTLRWMSNKKSFSPMSDRDKNIILERIISGIEAMGCKIELC